MTFALIQRHIVHMPFREKNGREPNSTYFGLIISILLRPLTFGFSLSTAKEVKQRDHYKCVDCHSSKRLVASHTIHNHEDREEYDNPDNGKTRCVYCEVVYHLKHWNHPESIGLTFERNLNGLAKQWVLLRTREQNELTNRFPKSIGRIRERCYNR